jgi:transposase InsO family protein
MSAAGPCCRRSFSPPGSWGQVPATAVRDELRRAFRRWGRPQRLRVDNGTPWGSSSDLPTALALWLIGLGVGLHWNPPATPQDNGVVERSQGTGKRWAEPHTCSRVEELQRRLEVMDRIQREKYPVGGQPSRLAAYPQLAHSGQEYSRRWEASHWSMDLVMAHLAGYAVPRRVDKTGHVSLYNRNYYVGAMHKAKMIYVMFDPEERAWLFADEEGRQLRRQEAQQITPERIVGLTVTERDAAFRRQRAAKHSCRD